jgi:hypothetical protein
MQGADQGNWTERSYPSANGARAVTAGVLYRFGLFGKLGNLSVQKPSKGLPM